jgi:hypothetical protein
MAPAGTSMPPAAAATAHKTEVSSSSDEYFLFRGDFNESCFSSSVKYTKLDKHASLKFPPNKMNSSEDGEN